MANTEILELEKLHDVSIDEVLKETGIERATYEKYRDGKEFISPEHAVILGKYFKVPASFFNRHNVIIHNDGTNSHGGPINTYNNYSSEGFYRIVVQLLLDKKILKTDIKDWLKDNEELFKR